MKLPYIPFISPTLSQLKVFLGDVFQKIGRTPQNHNARVPRPITAFYSIVVLLLFALTLGLSAYSCKYWTLWFVGGVGGITSFSIIAFFIYDVRSQRNKSDRQYSSNLANTVLTVPITIAVLTGIYIGIWYAQRTGSSFDLKQDVVEEASYPALVLFQERGWWAQANLSAMGPKCFINRYDDTAPNCTQLNGQAIDDSDSCNCASLWSQHVVENFQYRNRTYRYLEFRADERMICTRPTTLLWLQAPFDYNADKAEAQEGFMPSPGLSLAIFDPKNNLSYALENNYTRMIDINALGSTSINLDLFYRINLDDTAAYDYKITLSSTPSLNLVCNTGSNGTQYSGPCATRILLRISSFHRTILQEKKGISWTKIVNSVGAWYSLVQFVSWVLSLSAIEV